MGAGFGDYNSQSQKKISYINKVMVSDVKIHADAASRSVPKQIEHRAKIGRIAEDNRDLPYSFILESLLAQSEVNNHKVTRYVRRTARK
jgi:ParD-like antitoxin of type II bacterial toxin-antitoxin system